MKIYFCVQKWDDSSYDLYVSFFPFQKSKDGLWEEDECGILDSFENKEDLKEYLKKVGFPTFEDFLDGIDYAEIDILNPSHGINNSLKSQQGRYGIFSFV